MIKRDLARPVSADTRRRNRSMNINLLFKHWSYRLFTPGTVLREKYEAFKELLRHDARCHERMAEFQELLHGGRREDFARIRTRYDLFAGEVAGMVSCLERLAPGRYLTLKDYFRKFDFYIRFLLAPPAIDPGPPHVVSLKEIGSDGKQVGDKARNLALLARKSGAPIPDGFAVTVGAFHYFIDYNNLRPAIDALLAELSIDSPRSLARVSDRLRQLIVAAEVPECIAAAMFAAYDRLAAEGEPVVAVRSSAAGEDGSRSFAGQYKTVLHVGRRELLRSYLEVLASKYSPEALVYRISYGLTDEETAMSVLVVRMVEARTSGVLYTRAPVTGTGAEDDSCQQLHAVRGPGERLVSGAAVPEIYLLSREERPRLLERRGRKQGGDFLPDKHRAEEIGRWGMVFEKLHGDIALDIEWAVDSHGNLFFLQCRPLQTGPPAAGPAPETLPDKGGVFPVEENGPRESCSQVLLRGCECAAGGVGAGPVHRVDGRWSAAEVPTGAVLVSRDTPPSYVQVITRLAAVVAAGGSRASHFATVAREFGVPFLCGAGEDIDLLTPGRMVTVDADRGLVYAGVSTSRPRRLSHAAVRGVTPYFRVLESVLSFITPLGLVDPAGKNFVPEGCRSMHDIIRFAHEKAVQAMFTSARPGSGRGALKLAADIPLDVFLFDVGGGLLEGKGGRQGNIGLDQVVSRPFKALWKGLSHPEVHWKRKPFDWDAHERIELAGGVAPRPDSFIFASYAVVGADYLHFNLRFGYHFTIVDTLCGDKEAANYCMLRFAGGGGDFDHKSLRIDFITLILEELGFVVEKKGDLLEAGIQGAEEESMLEKLDMLGRLLGAAKLMDMVLEDDEMVRHCVAEFFRGRYSFSEQG